MASKADARMSRVICHRCKDRGHYSRDCPSRAQRLQTTESVDRVEGLEGLSFVEIGGGNCPIPCYYAGISRGPPCSP